MGWVGVQICPQDDGTRSNPNPKHPSKPPIRGNLILATCGWTKSISQHFESIASHNVGNGIYRGRESPQGFLGGAEEFASTGVMKGWANFSTEPPGFPGRFSPGLSAGAGRGPGRRKLCRCLLQCHFQVACFP